MYTHTRTSNIFVLEKQGCIDVEGEERKGGEGLWCIIYLCSGWAEEMGCELGEEKGGQEGSGEEIRGRKGGWAEWRRQGLGGWRGNPTLRSSHVPTINHHCATVSLPMGMWARINKYVLSKWCMHMVLFCYFAYGAHHHIKACLLSEINFGMYFSFWVTFKFGLILRNIPHSGKFILAHAQNEASSRQMVLYSFHILLFEAEASRNKKRKTGDKIGMEGWSKQSRLLHPWREEQICFVRRPTLRPHSLNPLPPPISPLSSIPPCSSYPLSLFFFSFPQVVYTFLPSTCLAAGYGWGKMQRKRGCGFQMHIPSGKVGVCGATWDQ